MYSQSRIRLLSDQEIKDIYAMPQFNHDERSLYFALTPQEMLVIKKNTIGRHQSKC